MHLFNRCRGDPGMHRGPGGTRARERLVPAWGRDGAERALKLKVAKKQGVPNQKAWRK